MIFLGKITATLGEARELAQKKLLDGSGYRKFKEVIAAQGGNPQVLDRFELLPNATGAREITSPRAGYVSAIDAELIGQASAMIGAGRDTKEDSIDPGRRRDPGSEGRPEDRCGRRVCAACTTRAKSMSKKPRSWWKMRSASPAPRPKSAS